MRLLLTAVLAALSALAAAQVRYPEEQRPAEEAVQLPVAPAQAALLEVSMGPTASARVFVDPASLVVAKDEVVRYTLVIISSGGARNVSFEGMRCNTRERKAYAFGRPDGSWAEDRNAKWVPVEQGGPNSPYAALFRSYFCPDGGAIPNPAEGLRLLRVGGKRRVCDPDCVLWK